MKNIRHELLNDVLTGLLVAATFALVSPGDAAAQIATTINGTGAQVLDPAMQGLSYLSYGIGAVMVVAGIAHAKKHADQPSSNPLGPAIGKLAAGAAFLAAPTMIGAIASTGTALGGGAAAVKTIPGV